MNLIKTNFVLLNLTVLCLSASCSSSGNMNSQPLEKIEFVEERRLNHTLNMEEAEIINSAKDLIELYGKLHNPEISRSAPIPAFDENTESVLVLKPKLKQLKYGDIEIESVRKSDTKLIVDYKEIETWEFTENRWSDPIVILRVSEKPSEIQLNRIN